MKLRLLCTLALIAAAYSFYIPGAAPSEFVDGDFIDLKVNPLTTGSPNQVSDSTYYSLPFCSPSTIQDQVENLEEILRGERVENSPFLIQTTRNESCHILCAKNYSNSDLSKFSDKLKHNYRVNWLIDRMPATTSRTFQDARGNTKDLYEVGFPLGERVEVEDAYDTRELYHLNNHVHIKLYYNTSRSSQNGIRIVGFEVEPKSIQHPRYYSLRDSCDGHLDDETTPLELRIPKGMDALEVVWTYSVSWKESDTEWSQRWDKYIPYSKTKIQYFNIINCMMIVLFFVGTIAMIGMRNLHADFHRYNARSSKKNAANELEEIGWKLVHAEVFRPPAQLLLFSVLTGTGVQVISIALISIVFGALAVWMPANRWGLVISAYVLYMITSFLSGYFSTRTYRMMNGRSLSLCTALTALLVPGIVFSVLLTLNLSISGVKSSGAVPFSTLLSLTGLWFVVSVPLVHIGHFFASKKSITDNPVRTNPIPRPIPRQAFYMRPLPAALLTGLLPFGAFFIELFFVLNASWGHKIYYVFGFLLIIFVILIMTCAEISIAMCYFQLCNGDHRWWWRPYATAATSSLYLFSYSAYYFFSNLKSQNLFSAVLYFGYASILCLMFFLFTGTIGYYACLIFIRKIYAQIKVD